MTGSTCVRSPATIGKIILAATIFGEVPATTATPVKSACTASKNFLVSSGVKPANSTARLSEAPTCTETFAGS
jgi:hypothetical protein